VKRFICWNPTIEGFQGTSEDSDSMLDDFAWCWMFFAIMLDNFWTSSDKLWTMLDHFRQFWIILDYFGLGLALEFGTAYDKIETSIRRDRCPMTIWITLGQCDIWDRKGRELPTLTPSVQFLPSCCCSITP
jgi:hypothetical protein